MAIGTGVVGFMYGSYLTSYWDNVISKYIKQYKPTFDATGSKPTSATHEQVANGYREVTSAVGSAKKFKVTSNIIDLTIKTLVMEEWLFRVTRTKRYEFSEYNDMNPDYFVDYREKIQYMMRLVKDDVISEKLIGGGLTNVIGATKMIRNTGISSELTDDEKFVVSRAISVQSHRGHFAGDQSTKGKLFYNGYTILMFYERV